MKNKWMLALLLGNAAYLAALPSATWSGSHEGLYPADTFPDEL
jgi:hypothetical protein